MNTYTVFDKDNNQIAQGLFDQDRAIQLALESKGWVLKNEWGILMSTQIHDFRS